MLILYIILSITWICCAIQTWRIDKLKDDSATNYPIAFLVYVLLWPLEMLVASCKARE